MFTEMQCKVKYFQVLFLPLELILMKEIYYSSQHSFTKNYYSYHLETFTRTLFNMCHPYRSLIHFILIDFIQHESKNSPNLNIPVITQNFHLKNSNTLIRYLTNTDYTRYQSVAIPKMLFAFRIKQKWSL